MIEVEGESTPKCHPTTINVTSLTITNFKRRQTPTSPAKNFTLICPIYITNVASMSKKNQKLINRNSSDGSENFQTDTVEDSKLVHRQIFQKVCTAPPRDLRLEFPSRESKRHFTVRPIFACIG